MAKIHIYTKEDKDKLGRLRTILAGAFQSGNINFFLGSGASYPALPLAGNLEQEIDTLFKANRIKEASRKKFKFLKDIQNPTISLVKNQNNSKNAQSIQNYKKLIGTIEKILVERKTTLLAKQANIFTTNYDLLIEKAAEDFPAILLNDGFNRTPNLDRRYEFSPRDFFKSTFNIGNLYHYKVEIPALNLIKLHGSLSWHKDEEGIFFDISEKVYTSDDPKDEEIESFNGQFAIVLPQKNKFQETLMERVYYDLLRIYSNELDKENTLLIVFGFSFVDEHIYDITKRALKNPALRLIVFSYLYDEIAAFQKKFDGYNNVDIVGPEKDMKIDFSAFNTILSGDPLPGEVE